MIKLSIILPVYNVEKYIHTCLSSIFRQGIDEQNYEVIIINDGTKDNSMEVIQDIICEHSNITIINQDNQGLSVTRNNGIEMAKGEYVLMPDSDDLLVENSLSNLLDVAQKTGADLIVADFLKMNDEQIKLAEGKTLQHDKFYYIEKTGEQLFLEDLSPYQCYVWRTLFKRKFLLENGIRFIPGIYIQDVPFTHECYIKAQKCIKASWLLNIYRLGHESATSNFNLKKEKDFCRAIAKIWELRQTHALSPAVLKKIENNTYTSFSVMICSTSHAIRKASERVEIIDYIRQQAPDLTFKNGIKQRIVSFMFRKIPHTYIHLRYLYGKVVENKILPSYHHRIKRK